MINRRCETQWLDNTGVSNILRLPVLNSIDIYSAWRISRLVKRAGIDIIHCHTGRAHALGLIAKFLVPSARLVIHRRVAFEKSRTWAGKSKYLSSRNDRFIAVSYAVKQTLLDIGVSEAKISVIHSSLDLGGMGMAQDSSFKERLLLEFGIGEGVPLLLVAARLSREKGIDLLLAAFALLKTRGLKFHCLVAGGGPEMGRLKELRRKLGLAGEVTLLGVRNDVYSLMSASDVHVLPSLSEGLPSSLLEALYFGCYLVGSDAGGIPEIIRSDDIGLTFPSGSVPALADAVESAVMRRKSRNEVIAAGRPLIEREFSAAAMVRRHEDLYRSLA